MSTKQVITLFSKKLKAKLDEKDLELEKPYMEIILKALKTTLNHESVKPSTSQLLEDSNDDTDHEDADYVKETSEDDEETSDNKESPDDYVEATDKDWQTFVAKYKKQVDRKDFLDGWSIVWKKHWLQHKDKMFVFGNKQMKEYIDTC
jgi:hypothetical protein